MLVPGGRHQQDVTMLEDCLVEACDRARETHSKLGQLLDGPPVESAGKEQPSYLPALWTHDQLQTEKLAWPLPNQRYLTTSCMQVGANPRQNLPVSLAAAEMGRTVSVWLSCCSMSPVRLKNPQLRIACQTYLDMTSVSSILQSVPSVTGQETRAVQVQATCIIVQIIWFCEQNKQHCEQSTSLSRTLLQEQNKPQVLRILNS